MDSWIVNGTTIDRVAAGDRGLAYGDGLFETIRVQNAACMFLNAHLERLTAACAALDIPAPDHAELQRLAAELIGRQQCSSGTLKIIVTRGAGQRGYRYDRELAQPTVILGIEASPAPPEHSAGVRVRYCETRVSRNPALAGIKSLNRLPQVLARAEWDDPAITEGLMLDDRDNLIAGTMTNLFIVKDNRIMTAPVDQCGIAGIMRSKIFSWAAEMGVACDEQYFGLNELETAAEIFLTNSLIGIWPVNQVESLRFKVGPQTDRLVSQWRRARDAS